MAQSSAAPMSSLAGAGAAAASAESVTIEALQQGFAQLSKEMQALRGERREALELLHAVLQGVSRDTEEKQAMLGQMEVMQGQMLALRCQIQTLEEQLALIRQGREGAAEALAAKPAQENQVLLQQRQSGAMQGEVQSGSAGGREPEEDIEAPEPSGLGVQWAAGLPSAGPAPASGSYLCASSSAAPPVTPLQPPAAAVGQTDIQSIISGLFGDLTGDTLAVPPSTSEQQESVSVSLAERLSHLPLRDDVQLEIDVQDVDIFEDQVLGTGAVGKICKGKYRGRDVAIKLFTLDSDDAGGYSSPAAEREEDSGLDVELQIMGRLDHPNVLRVLGASTRDPQRCFLVEELCVCSLAQVLYPRHGPVTLPLPLVYQLAIEIFSGLEYLHSLGIIHRDIKPQSVLIGGDNIARISNFDLARCKYKTYLSSKKLDVGTVPYMAPECFSDKFGKVSAMSDIYSAAVLMGEMVTGQRPWRGMQEMSIIFKVVFEGGRPDIGDRCPEGLKELLRDCFQADPEKRPTSKEVLGRLSVLKEQAEQGEKTETAEKAEKAEKVVQAS